MDEMNNDAVVGADEVVETPVEETETEEVAAPAEEAAPAGEEEVA